MKKLVYFFDSTLGTITRETDQPEVHVRPEAARKDWENVGSITDCNLAFRRLATEFDFDVDAALRFYRVETAKEKGTFKPEREADFPVRVRMGAAALSELTECEYGSYEDHIHSDGAIGEIREGEYGEREFGDHGDYRRHIVELIERGGHKTVVILKNQDELDEFFVQSMTGTWGLTHERTAVRVFDELTDFVSPYKRHNISRGSIGF